MRFNMHLECRLLQLVGCLCLLAFAPSCGSTAGGGGDAQVGANDDAGDAAVVANDVDDGISPNDLQSAEISVDSADSSQALDTVPDVAAGDLPNPSDVPISSDAPDAALLDGADASCACGDHVCEAACAESIENCPADCAKCADGVCSPGESPATCAADCCGTCGDGKCGGAECTETVSSCPADCKTSCGNAICEKGENLANCPADCKPQSCGNGTCEPEDGGAAACPADCATTCGNCACEKGEDFASCPMDCGFCGDGVCSTCATLAENSGTCAKDCKGDGCSGGCDDGVGCTIDLCGSSGGCVHLPSAATCTDGNPCTDDTCDGKQGCVHANNTAACDDGNACTANDVCAGAVCAGSGNACDDGNLCTDDACDTATNSCTHAANTTACDDGNPCTTGEACKQASCAGGSGKDCSDNDTCTADSCEAGTGLCKHISIAGCVPALMPCNVNGSTGDGTCDYTQSCVVGCASGVCDTTNRVCVPCLTAMDCGTGFLCSAHQCIAESKCSSGADCKATNQVCDKADGVCADCVTGADCATDQACVEHKCVDAKPCKSDKECPSVCDLTSGVCVECNVTADCKSGFFCAAWNRCEPVVCTASGCGTGSSTPYQFACKADGSGYMAASSCADNSACTADSCSVDQGCKHTPLVGQACDDGHACTTADACDQYGSCSGTANNNLCDDGNSCTTDTCSAYYGCSNDGNDGASCDDGVACTSEDKCDYNGKCAGTQKLWSTQMSGTTVGIAVDQAGSNLIYATGAGVRVADSLAHDYWYFDSSNFLAIPTGAGVNTASPGAVAGGADGFFVASILNAGNTCTGETCGSSPTGIGVTKVDFQQNVVTNAVWVDAACASETLRIIAAADGGAIAACSTALMRVDSTGAVTWKTKLSGNAAFQNLRGLGQLSTGNIVLCGSSPAGAVEVHYAALTDGGAVGSPASVAGLKVANDCAVTSGDDVLVAGQATQSSTPAIARVKSGVVVSVFGASGLIASDGFQAIVLVGSEIFAASDAGHLVHLHADGTFVSDIALPAPASCYGTCHAASPLLRPLSGGRLLLSFVFDDHYYGAQPWLEAVDPWGHATCSGTDACMTSAGFVACDDGLPCTNDVCDLATGCTPIDLASGATCSDGLACTTQDTCTGGSCVGVALCVDGNPCTDDNCNAANGVCSYPMAKDGTPCADSIQCVGSGTCASGTCSGTAPNCDDFNPCTNDSCVAGKGCVHQTNTAKCDDNNPCTINDSCYGGYCGGQDNPCDDGNPCTTDSCTTDSGCQHVKSSCDDGNNCTADSCDSLSGCTHTPTTAYCSLGDNPNCYQDYCSAGVCTSKSTCDDQNPCTIDTCDWSGCTHTNAQDQSYCPGGSYGCFYGTCY